MVSASGPISTGILAGRPSGSQGPWQHGGAECEKDAKAAESARIRHESDLYVRPSWTDAAIALDQLEKVRKIINSLASNLRLISGQRSNSSPCVNIASITSYSVWSRGTRDELY
jgi:hypothetical protein